MPRHTRVGILASTLTLGCASAGISGPFCGTSDDWAAQEARVRASRTLTGDAARAILDTLWRIAPGALSLRFAGPEHRPTSRVDAVLRHARSVIANIRAELATVGGEAGEPFEAIGAWTERALTQIQELEGESDLRVVEEALYEGRAEMRRNIYRLAAERVSGVAARGEVHTRFDLELYVLWAAAEVDAIVEANSQGARAYDRAKLVEARAMLRADSGNLEAAAALLAYLPPRALGLPSEWSAAHALLRDPNVDAASLAASLDRVLEAESPPTIDRFFPSHMIPHSTPCDVSFIVADLVEPPFGGPYPGYEGRSLWQDQFGDFGAALEYVTATCEDAGSFHK